MKPASSPVPSGDREMARNLITALERHHEVDIATEFVSWDGKGDPEIQDLATQGTGEARALIEKWQTGTVAKRPDAWFTYHVYHKAPDWVGPAVSEALNIPYFMAEVSHAPKQAGGPWDIGYCAAESAIRNAQGIFGLSTLDATCVLPLLEDPGRYYKLAPFTDTRPFARAMERRAEHRNEVVARFGFDPAAPVLLAVGMMREGDKLASYGVLAEALDMLSSKAWNLLIVGDGPAREAVERVFHEVPSERIGFAGTTAPNDLPGLYAAADLMVWPAINEAYGMAMLEAQATGLPVVAGRTGGVPDVVHDGETGLLCPVGDAGAFANTMGRLLAEPGRLKTYSARAAARASAKNDISAAADALDRILRSGRKAEAA